MEETCSHSQIKCRKGHLYSSHIICTGANKSDDSGGVVNTACDISNNEEKNDASITETIQDDDDGSVACPEDEKSRRGPMQTVVSVLTEKRGIFLTLLSAFSQALASIGIAYLSGSVSAYEINFARSLFQLLCSTPLVVFKKVPIHRYTWRAYVLLFLRGFLGSISTILMYVTYQIMSVGSAKSIQYTAPIFAGFFGWAFLKEPCSLMDTLLSFVTLGGVVLVAQPGMMVGDVASEEPTSGSIWGPVFSLCAAIFNAITLIATRQMGAYGVSSVSIIFVYSIVGSIITATITSILQQWTIPGCDWDRIILLGNGMLHTASLVLLFLALRTERAVTVSMVHSSDILFSFILEFIFFGTVPNYLTIIGAVVIIGSIFLMTLKAWWMVSRKRADMDDVDDEGEIGDQNGDANSVNDDDREQNINDAC